MEIHIKVIVFFKLVVHSETVTYTVTLQLERQSGCENVGLDDVYHELTSSPDDTCACDMLLHLFPV